ncbi:MAG TPA: hypothetical protein VMM35_09645 [Longimicrobiales bacterium]|nr:hypothetical protein [Longimicrobiales bacterium]
MPVSQERIELEPDLSEVRLRPKAGADDRPDEGFERLDPDELVARVIAQVPEPRKHLVQAARAQTSETATAGANGSEASELDSAERKAAPGNAGPT